MASNNDLEFGNSNPVNKPDTSNLVFIEKVNRNAILWILSPAFYIFEMAVILPGMIDLWDPTPYTICGHIFVSTFLFLNVIGNFIMCYYNESFLEESKPKPDWIYCFDCKRYRPPKAWHCRVCGVCIVNRDHHCFFMSACIGGNNRRYYTAYLFYMTISMIYALYVNHCYVEAYCDNFGVELCVYSLVSLLSRGNFPMKFSGREMAFAVFYVANIGILIWAGSLFCIHVRNILNGVTSYERKHTKEWSYSWRNFKEIFGERWLRAILCPISSVHFHRDCKRKCF